jgi:hypothetical protein
MTRNCGPLQSAGGLLKARRGALRSPPPNRVSELVGDVSSSATSIASEQIPAPVLGHPFGARQMALPSAPRPPASPLRSTWYAGSGSSIASPVPRLPLARLQPARFAKDMASADGSSIIGSNTASSRRHNASQIRHMLSQSMTPLTDGYKNGWQTPDIFVHHAQRKLFEVHYARTVRMLSGRCEPSAFGM